MCKGTFQLGFSNIICSCQATDSDLNASISCHNFNCRNAGDCYYSFRMHLLLLMTGQWWSPSSPCDPMRATWPGQGAHHGAVVAGGGTISNYHCRSLIMTYFIAPHFVMAVIIMYTVITFYIALTSIYTLQAWTFPGCKRTWVCL